MPNFVAHQLFQSRYRQVRTRKFYNSESISIRNFRRKLFCMIQEIFFLWVLGWFNTNESSRGSVEPTKKYGWITRALIVNSKTWHNGPARKRYLLSLAKILLPNGARSERVFHRIAWIIRNKISFLKHHRDTISILCEMLGKPNYLNNTSLLFALSGKWNITTRRRLRVGNIIKTKNYLLLVFK